MAKCRGIVGDFDYENSTLIMFKPNGFTAGNIDGNGKSCLPEIRYGVEVPLVYDGKRRLYELAITAIIKAEEEGYSKVILPTLRKSNISYTPGLCAGFLSEQEEIALAVADFLIIHKPVSIQEIIIVALDDKERKDIEFLFQDAISSTSTVIPVKSPPAQERAPE